MTTPKRKNNINVYPGRNLTDRRQELLDKITKSDVYLPDPILHDDLDMGMLEFVKKNFIVVSDGIQIPIIDKMFTIQRWGEISNNWEFMDGDNNIKLPFILLVRKPDPQPGTNPSVQRTIPDRKTFYYQSILNWNGNQNGADIYKIPQPVAVDISYELMVVCQKIRDLNKLNKIILQKFSSRQAYTIIKGHYIPIVLDNNSDESPIDTLDGRRFYIQKYEFTMLGLLIDEEEFEVKPAINRLILIAELMDTKTYNKSYKNDNVETVTVRFVGDGSQVIYGVGEIIGYLLFVSVNGVVQQLGVNYYHVAKTSRITFITAPLQGDEITISYYPSKSGILHDINNNAVLIENEQFIYDGSSLTFTLIHEISSILYLTINGLVHDLNNEYTINVNTVTLLEAPMPGSEIGISYFY